MSEGFGSSAFKSDRMLQALIFAVLIFGAFCGLLVGILVPLLGGIILAVIAYGAATFYLMGRWRSTRQEATLWALATAVERGMPLTSALDALSRQHDGRYAVRLQALSNLLNSGAPLGVAMELVPGTLPRESGALLHTGWDLGCIGGVLREVADSRSKLQPMRVAVAARIGYVLLLLATMEFIVGFLMYFIIPKFEAIFKDFGLSLPDLTILVIQASHVALSWAAPLLAVAVVTELGFFFTLPLFLSGWWNWELPGIDWLVRRRHTPTILRGLAWTIEEGKPLALGIVSLARGATTPWLRGRLERVLQDLVAGTDCWQALEQRGLIRCSDRAILAAATKVGNVPWALRETAAGAERRFAFRLYVALQSLFILIVIGLGAVVLLLTTSFFMPLVVLINSLSAA